MPLPQSTKKENEPGRQPLVDGVRIKVKLTSTLKDVADLLRTVSFLEVAQDKDAVSALYVESRDINKQPYVFSILKATEDSVEVAYSIPAEIAPKKRKLDMVRYLLNMLTLLDPYYEIDQKIVYQLMESSIKDTSESITLEYSKLYTQYDTLQKDVKDLKARVRRLTDENEGLSNENYELKNKADELLLRLKNLENLPDDVIRSKLQEWIMEHSGEINILEFSKVYNVNEVRVEEMLNLLIREGYIEAIG
ncbi:hypothetical protein HYT84_00975 [Candidatus Micrarchaeota archaeon]|nr:hypothetical protein [Candidatus Micrarchaeota archaeon]